MIIYFYAQIERIYIIFASYSYKTMNNLQQKIKNILLPYIYITIGSTLSYLLFYWIFAIKSEANIKDNLLNFIIPAIIAAIAHVVWLRPRVKLLTFKTDNGPLFYYMVAIGFNLWIMIVSANLLTLKTNDLIHLKNISDIETKPKSRFYTIANFDIPEQYGASTFTINRSGKNNEYVNLNLYFTAPITLKNQKITNINGYKYWLCQTYHIQKSAHKSDDELNKIFTEFANTCDLNFHNQKYLEGLDHFEKLKYSDEKIQGIEAIKKSMPGEIPDDIILLETTTSKLSDDANSYTKYIFISFFSGIGIFFLFLLYPKYKEVKPSSKKNIRKKDDLRDMLMFLIPNGEHYITSILLDINIIVFVALLFFDVDFMNPTAPQLIASGGINGVLFAGGDYWRLLTSMFLHAGFGHLVYNMIALGLIGALTEPILGRKRYLFLYIGSGIISSFAVVLFGKAGVSVGASGAIFGLFAVGFAYALINKIKPLITLIGIYAGSSLLLGFIIPGTDNIGHLSGIAGGLLIYFVMREIYPELKDYSEEIPPSSE